MLSFSQSFPSALASPDQRDPVPAVRRTVGRLRREHARRSARVGWAGPAWPAWAARPWVAQPAVTGGRASGDLAEGATDTLAGLLAELRDATTAYAVGLRTGGARPEQMLPQVKALVRHAMAAERWLDPEAAQVLTAQVVCWSIDAYYAR